MLRSKTIFVWKCFILTTCLKPKNSFKKDRKINSEVLFNRNSHLRFLFFDDNSFENTLEEVIDIALWHFLNGFAKSLLICEFTFRVICIVGITMHVFPSRSIWGYYMPKKKTLEETFSTSKFPLNLSIVHTLHGKNCISKRWGVKSKIWDFW